MSRLFKWLRRPARKGQTTAEYVIILGLVALGSIAVILLFGNQIRALFGAGTNKMAGRSVDRDDYSVDQGEVDAARTIDDMPDAFENP